MSGYLYHSAVAVCVTLLLLMCWCDVLFVYCGCIMEHFTQGARGAERAEECSEVETGEKGCMMLM